MDRPDSASTLTAPLAVALREAGLALERCGVSFALAGGLAVNVWGRQRATSDVDLAVFVSSFEALRSVVEQAQSPGFLSLDPRPWRFPRAWVGRLILDPASSNRVPQPVVVDLIRPAGRGASAWAREVPERAVRVPVLGASVPVVRPEDLILFKLLVTEDRGYDFTDALSVVERVGSDLDLDHLRRWARQLGVLSGLRRLGLGASTRSASTFGPVTRA